MKEHETCPECGYTNHDSTRYHNHCLVIHINRTLRQRFWIGFSTGTLVAGTVVSTLLAFVV